MDKSRENAKGKDKEKTSPSPTSQPSDEDRDSSINISKASVVDKSWIGTKTKAGQERKRLPLACRLCRSKKIKCSGQKPTCGFCARNNLTCVYSTSDRTHSASRSPTLPPRSRSKNTINTKSSGSSQDKMQSPTEYISQQSPLSQTSAHSPIVTVSRMYSQSYEAPNNSISLPRMATLQDRYSPRTYSRNISEELSHDNRNLPPPTILGQRMITDSFMPPLELREHLANLFFKYIYSQTYPVIHKPSFMTKLKNDQLPPVLIYSLCAVSSRFSDRMQIATTPSYTAGEQFAIKARELILENYDKADITNITSLLLLCIHEFGADNSVRAYHFGGMAVRMANALNMFKEVDGDILARRSRPNGLTWTVHETRRRLFWSLFVLDRFNSAGTGRPQCINAEDCQIQLPCDEISFCNEIPRVTETLDGKIVEIIDPIDRPKTKSVHMDTYAYIIRIVSLWGSIARYQANLKTREAWRPDEQFNHFIRSISEFRAALPERIELTIENLRFYQGLQMEGSLIFLHVLINKAELAIYRFAIAPHADDNLAKDLPQDFLRSCAEKGTDAAFNISRIMTEAEESHCITSAPFLSYCLFSATFVLIQAMRMYSHEELWRPAKQYIQNNLRLMDSYSRFWGTMDFYRKQIIRTYEQFESKSEVNIDRSRPFGESWGPIPSSGKSHHSIQNVIPNSRSSTIRDVAPPYLPQIRSNDRLPSIHEAVLNDSLSFTRGSNPSLPYPNYAESRSNPSSLTSEPISPQSNGIYDRSSVDFSELRSDPFRYHMSA